MEHPPIVKTTIGLTYYMYDPHPCGAASSRRHSPAYVSRRSLHLSACERCGCAASYQKVRRTQSNAHIQTREVRDYYANDPSLFAARHWSAKNATAE